MRYLLPILLMALPFFLMGGTHYDHPEYPPQYEAGKAPHYDTSGVAGGPVQQLRLALPLDASGWEPGTWPLSPAPDIAWWGGDPTGSVGDTSHLFVASGTPALSESPYCPDGDWTDLGDCVAARRFDASDYYTASGNDGGDDIADCTEDCSICAVAARDPSVVGRQLISQTNTGDNDGWHLEFGPNFLCRVEGSSGAANAQAIGYYGYALYCCTIDADGDITVYVNESAATPTAHPGGTVSSDGSPLEIANIRKTNPTFAGDIVWLAYWDGVVLSAAQIKTMAHTWMGVPNPAGYTVETNNNSSKWCCWVEGKLVCYETHNMAIGCEVAPGAPLGAGSPNDGGILISEAVTVQNAYSEDLSTGWTENGTSVVACSQASTPFLDGRTTCKITDDDAAGQEYIYQTVDITDLDTDDSVTLCLYAAADSSQDVDVRFEEKTGVDCGTPSNNNFDSQSVTTTWSQRQFTATIKDGDCEEMDIIIAPHDAIATDANTGHNYIMAQFMFEDHCPPFYVLTEAAEVTSSKKEVTVDLSGGDIMNGSGELVGKVSTNFEWTKTVYFWEDTMPLIAYHDVSEATQYSYISMNQNGTNTFRMVQRSDAAEDMLTAVGSQSFTLLPGTKGTISWDVNYNSDVFEVTANSSQGFYDTTSLVSPTGLDELVFTFDPKEGTGELAGTSNSIIRDLEVWR